MVDKARSFIGFTVNPEQFDSDILRIIFARKTGQCIKKCKFAVTVFRSEITV